MLRYISELLATDWVYVVLANIKAPTDPTIGKDVDSE